MIASVVAPQWVAHPARDETRARELAHALGAPPAIGQVLVNRGHGDLESARRFLAPSLEDLGSPSGLADLDRGATRIRQAVASGEPLLVQGDYDVDGITSTFLLQRTLERLGGRVHVRIPHRTRDGYGLSASAVTEAHRLGCRLIVTVDCGIGAHVEIEQAKSLGIDTVVTDHHAPGPRLPAAHAVVNPRRPDCSYPFKSLAGVGVTFKLAQTLLAPIDPDLAWEFLDVVALGTIADVVPLIGENRAFAWHGLARMNRSQRPGIRALIDVAGLGGRRIGSGHVAFVLAPRLNAAGRMGNAEQALRLLLARDEGEALAHADSLEDDNHRRRQHDERAAAEAMQRVVHELGWPDCAAIVLWSDTWHPGVIGIVASRLVERFRRPALLIALDGATGRGSGRGLSGLDLTEVLAGCDDLLVAYGGHALAAGLTVERERLPALRERFDRLVRERLTLEECAPRLTIDADVSIAECDPGLIEWLDQLAPFGLENPEPLFQAEVTFESLQTVGDGKHLRMRVSDRTGSAEAIGFGLGHLIVPAAHAGRGAIAFALSENQWQGETRTQLRIKGVRLP